MDEKIRLGISSCLLGNKVRYDGQHKHDRFLTDTLGRYVEWVPVCPEVECGLPIPREAMRLVGDPDNPRLMTTHSGIDQTERMVRWAATRVDALDGEHLCGFVFKSRSPSSGMQGVKVYTPEGMPSNKGVGLFARTFMERYPLLPVEDEGRLHDSVLRENFIERIFIFRRWQEYLRSGAKIRDLVTFHTEHKLLILAHSAKHYTALGRLVAAAKQYKTRDLNSAYVVLLMEGLRMRATVKKHTNVLQHMVGYFKDNLTHDEKQEIIEVIDTYAKGLVPLIVPVTLVKHYVRKYDEPYLKRQYYLNPHPMELMLRNHV
jgi:uncharacterized protein YbgA (DUF1722 family)/uncharacterized protein YbbK (DUF523 family)